jgi:hypothetical protein
MSWFWVDTPVTIKAKNIETNTQETVMATTTKASATTPKKTARAAPRTTRAIGGLNIKPTSRRTAVGAEQRRNYIEVAAYYIAERRGFIGGNEMDDWAAAEAEIDRLLSEGKLNG